jgi:hypothetical protein
MKMMMKLREGIVHDDVKLELKFHDDVKLKVKLRLKLKLRGWEGSCLLPFGNCLRLQPVTLMPDVVLTISTHRPNLQS